MYKRLSSISPDLNQLRENGRTRGKEVGWPWELLPLTIKEGNTTYMASAPGSGKTEFWLECLINLSCKYGWKHAICSPETGNFEDVYAELCYKFIGKPYIKGNNSMDESEKAYAEQFIDEHFIVVDPVDDDMSIQQFYDMVDEIEIDLGFKINTTTIDPWNELAEEYLMEDLGREDKFLSRTLGYVRKNARGTGRHNAIITHVRDQKSTLEGNIRYYPIPTARDFAGGQVWFRKGNLMIIPWRPPFGLSDENDVPYKDNEVHIKIAKSKPKGVARNGTYKLYLDKDRYQYYMLDNGKRVYADRGEYGVKVDNKDDLFAVESADNKDLDLPF